MKDEVIAQLKNIILNSYVRQLSPNELFFGIGVYIEARKGVQLNKNLDIRDPNDIFLLQEAFEYAKIYFEAKFGLYKLINRDNQLIAINFGPFISQENARSPVP